jgi:hypothetical protein
MMSLELYRDRDCSAKTGGTLTGTRWGASHTHEAALAPRTWNGKPGRPKIKSPY